MTYAALIEKLRRSTVQVLSGRGGGSGVVWDRGGLVVTNAHVAAGKYAEVVDAAGQHRQARIIRRDRERDLALLVVAGEDLARAEIGDSDRLRAGEVVVAVGMPGAFSTVAGVIHTAGPGRKWVQADLHLAPGYSGGILADAGGRVIGINTMIFRGIGLAIPSNGVSKFVREELRGARAA